MDNMDMDDEVVETKPERKVEEQKNVQLSVPTRLVNVLFSLAALVLFIIFRIVRNFGGGSQTFYGLMSILVYSLAFVGVVFVYWKEQKVSAELWFNVIVLAIALGFM